MEIPPPLAWVPGYAASMAAALGCSVSAYVRPTQTPLLYLVVVTFGEEIHGQTFLRLWNLFQMYAGHNGAHPTGKMEKSGRQMTVQVAVERRLGEPRDENPASSEIRLQKER